MTSRVAKPAIAVTPEASTAAPVRVVGAAQRLAGRAPLAALLVVAGGEDDAELGGDRDHQRAERRRHRVERDTASASRPARPSRSRGRSGPAAPGPACERAVGGEQRQRDRREPGEGRASSGCWRGRRSTRPPSPAAPPAAPRFRAAGRCRSPAGRSRPRTRRSASAGRRATGRGCRTRVCAVWPSSPVRARACDHRLEVVGGESPVQVALTSARGAAASGSAKKSESAGPGQTSALRQLGNGPGNPCSQDPLLEAAHPADQWPGR